MQHAALPVRLAAALFGLAASLGNVAFAASDWSPAIVGRPADWFATAEARRIADSVLNYQSAEGGWPKNTDLGTWPPAAKDAAYASDGRANTFDNDGTTLPMEFLARVASASPDNDAYVQAFTRGLDYALAAQYPNGGWPQFYPLRDGYYARITFNDDAMVRVLRLLREVATGAAPYAFVDAERRTRAQHAVARGVDAILRTQIRREGDLAGWCAQHDETTLEPAWARAYEPPSLSGNESVGILRFLMGIDDPSPEVIAAIEGGVRWLRASAIEGVRIERYTNDEGKPDRRVVEDASAAPIWARFYDLETNRPIFLGRDSVVRYAFAEIEYERRNGYAYYGTWPRTLLERDYPAWKKKRE